MGARPAKTKKKGNNGCGCLIFALAFLSMIFTIFVGTSQHSISSAAISFSAKQAELLQSTYATAAATPITLSISSAITNLMISLAATPGPAPLANAPVDARLVHVSAPDRGPVAGHEGKRSAHRATAQSHGEIGRKASSPRPSGLPLDRSRSRGS